MTLDLELEIALSRFLPGEHLLIGYSYITAHELLYKRSGGGNGGGEGFGLSDGDGGL